MKNIDYTQPLSEEDKQWLRAVGLESRVLDNERNVGLAEVSTPDAGSSTSEGQSPQGSPELDDDYDEWKMGELDREVNSRDPKPTVTGTGKGGAVTKVDLIAALRAWDREHPEAE